MKQQIIELKKKLLLVELPEGATDIEKSFIGDIIFKDDCLCTDVIFLSKDRLVKFVIGKLTDIKEEQFGELVPESNKLFGGKRFNYKKGANIANTAKESFFSKLEADGIYFENPIEKPTVEEFSYYQENDAEGHTNNSFWEDEDGAEQWDNAICKWYIAQEKVWDINRCWLFEII